MQLIVVCPRRAWLMARVATWAVVLSTTVRFCALPTALNLLTVKPAGKSGASFDQPEIVTAVDAVLGVNFLVFTLCFIAFSGSEVVTQALCLVCAKIQGVN
jgi:hypothetical protein